MVHDCSRAVCAKLKFAFLFASPDVLSLANIRVGLTLWVLLALTHVYVSLRCDACFNRLYSLPSLVACACQRLTLFALRHLCFALRTRTGMVCIEV